MTSLERVIQNAMDDWRRSYDPEDPSGITMAEQIAHDVAAAVGNGVIPPSLLNLERLNSEDGVVAWVVPSPYGDQDGGNDE